MKSYKSTWKHSYLFLILLPKLLVHDAYFQASKFMNKDSFFKQSSCYIIHLLEINHSWWQSSHGIKVMNPKIMTMEVKKCLQLHNFQPSVHNNTLWKTKPIKTNKQTILFKPSHCNKFHTKTSHTNAMQAINTNT